MHSVIWSLKMRKSGVAIHQIKWTTKGSYIEVITMFALNLSMLLIIFVAAIWCVIWFWKNQKGFALGYTIYVLFIIVLALLIFIPKLIK